MRNNSYAGDNSAYRQLRVEGIVQARASCLALVTTVEDAEGLRV